MANKNRSVYLPEELLEKAAVRAAQDKRSFSEYVQALIEQDLQGGAAAAGDDTRILEDLSARFPCGRDEALQAALEGRNQKALITDLLRALPEYLHAVRRADAAHEKAMRDNPPSDESPDKWTPSPRDEAEMEHAGEIAPVVIPAGEHYAMCGEVDRLHGLLVALNREKRLDGIATVETAGEGKRERLVNWDATLRNVGFGPLSTGYRFGVNDGQLERESGKPRRSKK